MEIIVKIIEALFKISTEEPGKISQGFINGIKTIFNLLIADFLYRVIIGNYVLIELTSYAAWKEYIMSGRVLICLFF